MKDTEECFRVRGIPFAFDKSEVLKHVSQALSLGDNAKMRIRSLAPEPYPSDEKMATVDFDTRPTCLSRDNSAREWSVFCDCDECTADESSLPFTVDAHFRDITVLHWPEEEQWQLDLVAVPGLGGHAFGSFKAKEGTGMWLRDYLPAKLPGVRVFTFGYDAHLVGSNSFQNVEDLGLKVRDAISRITGPSVASNERRPLVIIGHSLGGIVLKQAILSMMGPDCDHYGDVLASITGILFFGVPNRGMEIESLLPMVYNQPNEELVRTLRHDSDTLIRQTEQFIKQFQGQVRGIDFNRVKIFSFYETQTSPTAQKVDDMWKMNGAHAILVGKSSATHGRPWEIGNNFIRPINTDHSGLVKFISRHDEYYLSVFSLLRDFAGDKHSLSKEHPSKAVADCENFLRSFHFPTVCDRDEWVQCPTESTIAWFMNHESYKKWLDHNNEHALLKITGQPGVGKSTLMSGIAEKTWKEFGSRAAIFSFFFDGTAKENNILTKSSTGFYRSILCQVLATTDLLSIPGVVCALSIFAATYSNGDEAREDELRHILWKVLAEAVPRKPVFVFIDALDECDNVQSAAKIMEFFSLFISEISSKLHLCVSYDRDITPSPMDVQLFHICMEKETGHKIAIQEIVERNLREIEDDEKRNTAQTAIMHCAEGNYLWAILVCTEAVQMAVAGDSTTQIQESIQRIPPTLDGVFERLLSRIPENKHKQSIKLFQWIFYATRPLSAKELQHALAIDAGTEKMSVEQLKRMNDFPESIHDFEHEVKTLSRGLVDVREINGGQTIRPIHETVFQYLFESGLDFLETSRCTDTARTRILKNPAVYRGHNQLAQSCIRLLHMPLKDHSGYFTEVRLVEELVVTQGSDRQSPYRYFQMKLSTQQHWVDVAEYSPLLQYASSSARHHVEEGCVNGYRTSGILSRRFRRLRDPAVKTSWNRMFVLAQFGAELDSRVYWATYDRLISRFSAGETFKMVKKAPQLSQPTSHVTVRYAKRQLPLCAVYRLTKVSPHGVSSEHSVFIVPHVFFLLVPQLPALGWALFLENRDPDFFREAQDWRRVYYGFCSFFLFMLTLVGPGQKDNGFPYYIFEFIILFFWSPPKTYLLLVPGINLFYSVYTVLRG